VDAGIIGVASVELVEVLLFTLVVIVFAVEACVEVVLAALSSFLGVVVFVVGDKVEVGRGHWPWHISHSVTKPWLMKVHTCEAG
jgi:hypothetical protein